MNVSIEDLVASAIKEGKSFRSTEAEKTASVTEDSEAVKLASELEQLAEDRNYDEEAAALEVHEQEKQAKLNQASELIDALIAVCDVEEGEVS